MQTQKLEMAHRELWHKPARSVRHAHTRQRIGYLHEQIRLPEYMKAHSFLRYIGGPNVSYH